MAGVIRSKTKEKSSSLSGMQLRSIFCFFFLILILHLAAILLFTRGFLLTRTELPYFSKCSDVSQSLCFPPHTNKSNSSSNVTSPKVVSHNVNRNPGCWTRPAVDRLVIIVLDALRFDFVAPSTFFEEKKPWMDKLRVLQKLASEEGLSAKIFKAIADPPTTSLQRLKGLTTGGLPTFIDVGNSFGAPVIVEDNLIYQLAQNGKRVVMMGDDTWFQLFPQHFNKSYPYPSFNVKDLDTVDDGCIKHLFPSLYEDDWDVLVAHFLGVDHAGHIFGVNSIPMIEKLEQYNAMLEKVVEVLQSQSQPGGLHENTLLLVMGDHGQTINGDHGGGGAEEVETAIFAMSLKEPPSSFSAGYESSSCQLDLGGKTMCISTIQQLDFAATVSALIGVPFPFGRCICLDNADKDDGPKSAAETVEINMATTEENMKDLPNKQLIKKEVKDANSDGEDKMEDSPVMGLLTGDEKTKTKTKDSGKNCNKGIPSEKMIEVAIKKRAAYFKANSDDITMGGARKLLEEDLELEKNSLLPFKKFIAEKIDHVLSASAAAASKVKPKIKTENKISNKKVSKNVSREESSDYSDGEIEKNKKPVQKNTKKTVESKKRKRGSKEIEAPSEKEAQSSEGNSGKINAGSASEDSDSASPAAKPTKMKKEAEAPAYGKHVDNLKSIIKSCGMSVPPVVYKRVKQIPENKREAALIKELKDILSKEGLSSNPSEKEIKDVRKKKERLKELEGIDMSNIVSSTRRRSSTSFPPPLPKPKVPVESDSDEGEEDDGEDSENDEEDSENDDEDVESGDLENDKDVDNEEASDAEEEEDDGSD